MFSGGLALGYPESCPRGLVSGQFTFEQNFYAANQTFAKEAASLCCPDSGFNPLYLCALLGLRYLKAVIATMPSCLRGREQVWNHEVFNHICLNCMSDLIKSVCSSSVNRD